jgi:multiple sugar transport system ATP-binding protein
MARVTIENLTKTFKQPKGKTVCAVNHANLEIKDGEFMVLVGPSGCGKTTLLRLTAGLEEVDEGNISLDGSRINGVAPGDRDVAMVFQTYALYPHMSAYENMAFGLTLRKVPRAEIDQRVRATAALLGLADCLERKPRELSGGQRQRVALGRAIVRNPKVFLFDEPLSNLDAPLRAQMRLELSRLHDRIAATMLYVTHDQTEAMTMGNRIAVMKEGAIQQVAEPMKIYNEPANLFVAGFIGSPPMNLFRGTLLRRDGGMFFEEQPSSSVTPTGTGGFSLRLDEALVAGVAAYMDRSVVFGIRPEHIADKSQSDASTSGECVEAVIEAVEPLGPETHLHASIGAQSFIGRVSSDFSAKVGQRIPLAFDISRGHWFDAETGVRISIRNL